MVNLAVKGYVSETTDETSRSPRFMRYGVWDVNEMCMEDKTLSVDVVLDERKGNKPTTCPKSALATALPEKHRNEAGRLETSPALRLTIPRPRIPSLHMWS